MNKVLVLGKGKSGASAANFLCEMGYLVENVNTDEIEGKGKIKEFSFICISPGISINDRCLEFAKQENVKICGELELGFRYLECLTIAITGTNGKTTTTTLIGQLCKKIVNTYVGGNIGIPVTTFCKKVQKNDLCVLEVSSFQAESFQDFKPYIGIFLNFTDDHLNRHGTRENYLRAKMNMLKNQDSNDIAILNYDDKLLQKVACNIKSNIFYFSTKCKVRGCYIGCGSIYFNNGDNEEKVCNLPENICGEHNKQNILAAVCAAKLVGVKNNDIYDVIRDFKPTDNRIECVGNVKGVTFINDSKSTNVASTLAAINSQNSRLVLILGGSDKGYNFDDLFVFDRNKVKAIVVIGETTKKIIESAKRNNFKNIYVESDMEQATRKAFSIAKKQEIVLLSPACASFDMFTSYEHRGNEFKRIVREIENENNKDAGKSKR